GASLAPAPTQRLDVRVMPPPARDTPVGATVLAPPLSLVLRAPTDAAGLSIFTTFPETLAGVVLHVGDASWPIGLADVGSGEVRLAAPPEGDLPGGLLLAGLAAGDAVQ